MKDTNFVGWFEIYVSNMDRAKKFYETVFQTELTELPKNNDIEYFMFPFDPEKKDISGALAKSPMIQPGKGGTVVYFPVEDIDSTAKVIKESGGKILREKMSIGEYGFIAFFQDTEENTVALHSK